MSEIPYEQLGFHVIAKPTGPVCNLRCVYCYYLEKERLWGPGENWRMKDDTLERYIEQYIAAQPPTVTEIEFAWQGGEPTLLGVEFFERAVALQKRRAPAGKKCVNSIQTNGTLLDERWAAFLREHEFLVGLSIDGPADLHDRLRLDRQGRPTFERVLQAVRLLRKHGVRFNALTVVHRYNADHPLRIYRFFKELGIAFIQLIPIVQPPEKPNGRPMTSDHKDFSVRPEQWGRFLIEIFDEWMRRDVGYVFVPLFDQALAAWAGVEPPLCMFQRHCGRALVLEHNGDLYSCDHFVTPEHRLGNIHESTIAEMARSERQRKFGLDKERTLPTLCRECPYLLACRGECPKNRLIQTPQGENGLNYLCAGYRMFYAHAASFLEAMAEEVRNGRPAANVMHRFQAHLEQKLRQASQSGQIVGRNDPCPCGSGRKLKHCCLKR